MSFSSLTLAGVKRPRFRYRLDGVDTWRSSRGLDQLCADAVAPDLNWPQPSLGIPCEFLANGTAFGLYSPAMRKLILLFLVGGVAVGAYNYSSGRDLFQLPGTSANALKNTVRETVGDAPAAVAAAAFTSKIKAKMALDDLVKAADINVDTDGSVVTLTGDVGSKDEQRRAVRIATETAGVTKVVNHLRVR